MPVTFNPKPRIRLPSGDIPEPKMARSRSWLPVAIVAWVVAVVIAHGMIHGWLPGLDDGSREPKGSRDSTAAPAALGTGAASASLSESVEAAPPSALPSAAPRDPDQLPDCEMAVRNSQVSESEVDESLPLDLSRSPFGVLLDSGPWAKPCRTSHAMRVHLCVTVKDGELLGLSVTSDSSDSSVSKCIAHAIARLALTPEATLRKVHLTIDLPPDNRR